jgi:predicted secreted protein
VFDDKRSKKVVLVAHCVFNQNAKIDRCAHYPGMAREIVDALMNAGIGIVQMPCPELLHLGLDRQVDPGAAVTVESEDTRVAQRMNEEPARALCREIAAGFVYQIREYKKNGFEVLGVIGINGSPTCGVETNWADGEEQNAPGVFIRALSAALEEAGITLPMRGVKVYQPEKAVEAILALSIAHDK